MPVLGSNGAIAEAVDARGIPTPRGGYAISHSA
jgi:hypothetical protein